MLGSLYGVAPQSMHARATSNIITYNAYNTGGFAVSSDVNRRHGRVQTTNGNRTLSSHVGPQAHTLMILATDESAMATRKLNIRRFGATWLRPAGIAKTLQAMHDEELEKAELAEQERRARLLAEETAAAEEAARRAAGDGADDGTHDEHSPAGAFREEMERDLDADIPAAGGGLEVLGYDADDGENEIDLDEEVPDAGSYEHTDTEVEDTDSEADEFPNFETSDSTADISSLTEETRRSTDASLMMDED